MEFIDQAKRILETELTSKVNSFGGYGKAGEVIFTQQLLGCPAVLLEQAGTSSLTLMSNGSTEFKTRDANNKELFILKGSFDPVGKRETGLPSHNMWISLENGTKIASLINPSINVSLKAIVNKVVKSNSPNRAMWFCNEFEKFNSVVKTTLAITPSGPAFIRGLYIKNTGKEKLSGSVWTYFCSSGTQFFTYNKDNWYDVGMPLDINESIVYCSVPYSDQLQIKRISSSTQNLTPVKATCDYMSFVGSCGNSALLPQAVLEDKMLGIGAVEKMNRFSTASVAANHFRFELAPNQEATIIQSLQYISEPRIIQDFRAALQSESPRYKDAVSNFVKAGKMVLEKTCDASSNQKYLKIAKSRRAEAFAVEIPELSELAEYVNSSWGGVAELYENCRAHGAQLADGIEVGTRDRAQDMWPKMKEDPARVRADLLHVLSLMIMTGAEAPRQIPGKPMSLKEKLHGTFPRQYPSAWFDRSMLVKNDNRPYSDSPLWLLNSLVKYLKETGDLTILNQRVKTVKLSNPEDPVNSGILGNEQDFFVHEIVFEIIESFERMAKDSPYGMAQILYGDWCDPVDMFGTSVIGDAKKRGHGRGVGVRLSCHLFTSLVEVIELFDDDNFHKFNFSSRIGNAKKFADSLRLNIIKFSWEDDAFLDAIHEFKADGSVPDYALGEKGYTLGSKRGSEFDGNARRVATPNAFGLALLRIEREYLTPIPNAREMVSKLLNYVDKASDEILGLPLYTYPIPNCKRSLDYVGRMGIIPAGTAENGEYHHGQLFMHYFRSLIDGQEDSAFKGFYPIMSASRHDDGLGGPFDVTTNSYAADKDDPHYGMGMNFGLSGSIVWMIEYFEKMAGLELDLASSKAPDLRIAPRMPDIAGKEMRYNRIIHYKNQKQIPLALTIIRGNKNEMSVNGKTQDAHSIADLSKFDRLDIKMELKAKR